MSDSVRDWSELKREVVEARNQAIKTDNQIKNLTMDIKGFEKRFDAIESRVRLSSVAVYVIIAVTIAVAAYVVTAMRSKTYEAEIAHLKEAVRDEHLAAEGKLTQLGGKLAELEGDGQKSHTAAQTALRILTLLDNKEETQAGDLLDTIDISHLTPLERKLCQGRFEDLRRQQAANSFRAGRQAVWTNHNDAAIPLFYRSLKLDGEGRFAQQATEQLAWALWNSKRYEEAEPVLRGWLQKAGGEPTGAARYMLATSLLRLGKKDEARTLLQQLAVIDNGRFTQVSRAYLAALDENRELPEDLPNGRIRMGRRNTRMGADLNRPAAAAPSTPAPADAGQLAPGAAAPSEAQPQ